MASEWAPYNINVNAVAPGFYNTPANKKWFDENRDFYEATLDKIPLRRLGDIDEIGGVAVFLASDAANCMTGSVLFIDGGYTIW